MANFEVQFENDDTSMHTNFDDGMHEDTKFGKTQPVNGKDGKSAYEIAVKNGFEGTETEWLESLRGEKGSTPQKGVDYWTEDDKAELVKDFSDTITDEWVFTLRGGSTVTKKVAIG